LPKSIGGALGDASGHFRITGLPPGNYTLRATRPAATSVPAEYSGVYKHGVATGSTVTLVLPGLGSVAGRVVTDEGRPLQQFAVAFAIWEPALDREPLPPGRPVASADGSFQIDEVPANRYAIAISAP